MVDRIIFNKLESVINLGHKTEAWKNRNPIELNYFPLIYF